MGGGGKTQPNTVPDASTPKKTMERVVGGKWVKEKNKKRDKLNRAVN